MKKLFNYIIIIIIYQQNSYNFDADLDIELNNAENLHQFLNYCPSILTKYYKAKEYLLILNQKDESFKRLIKINRIIETLPTKKIIKYIEDNRQTNPIKIAFFLFCFKDISNIDEKILDDVINPFIDYIINDLYENTVVPNILFNTKKRFNKEISDRILSRIKEKSESNKKQSLTLLLIRHYDLNKLPIKERYNYINLIIKYLSRLPLEIALKLHDHSIFDEEYAINLLSYRWTKFSDHFILLLYSMHPSFPNEKSCPKIKCIYEYVTNVIINIIVSKFNIIDIIINIDHYFFFIQKEEIEKRILDLNDIRMFPLLIHSANLLSPEQLKLLVTELDNQINNVQDEISIYTMKINSLETDIVITIIKYYIELIGEKKLNKIPYLLLLLNLHRMINFTQSIIFILNNINTSSIEKLKLLLVIYYKISFSLKHYELWKISEQQEKAKKKIEKNIIKSNLLKNNIKDLINKSLNKIKKDSFRINRTESKNEIEAIIESLVIEIENSQKIFFDPTFIINLINEIKELYELCEHRRYSMRPFFNKMKDYIKYSHGSAIRKFPSLIVEQKPYSFLSQNYYFNVKHLLSNNNITKNTEKSHIDNKFNKKNPNQKNPLFLIGGLLTCLAIIGVTNKYYHNRAANKIKL